VNTFSDLRIAAAPISWGVCEAPNWGYQAERARVLGDMRELGIAATEFGPAGFLPTDPDRRATVLADQGVRAIGGFVPLVLHREDLDPMPGLEAELDAFVAAGAEVLVVSVDAGGAGYDDKRELTDAEWALVASRLDQVRSRASARGIRAVLHQHVGTLIESPFAVDRLLRDTGIDLCLDTGHLVCGGVDPVRIVREHPDRIGHVHLKDVDADVLGRVNAGELSYTDGVSAGLFRPLGEGCARIAETIGLLQSGGFDGWYVMEQDCRLDGPEGLDAALADVRASLAFLAELPPRG
jgi:inosose dehydratase